LRLALALVFGLIRGVDVFFLAGRARRAGRAAVALRYFGS
jgi:hypothetical protein